MIYGLSDHGYPMRAVPGGAATCPSCGSVLIPKCGEIKIWHWAHIENDCDPWYEPESEWHLWWKNLVLPSAQEVIRDKHRADIVGKNGLVIELQSSAISSTEADERERFYGRMIWLFDAREFVRNVSFREREGYQTFRWKWPRETHALLQRSLFWDVGSGIFWVRSIHPEVPCGGWGYLVSYGAFVRKHLFPVLSPEGCEWLENNGGYHE